LNAVALDPMTNDPISGGTFTYNPAAGTKLYVGDGQTLSVSYDAPAGYNDPPDATVEIDVDVKPITVTPPAAITKVYDGTTAVSALTYQTVIGPGLAPGDAVDTDATMVFDTKDVDTVKTVTATGGLVLMEGAVDRTSNYDITYQSVSDAEITQAALSVTAPENITKEYDGTTAASGVTILDGLVGSDVKGAEATLTYDNKHVGTNKSVTPSGIVIHDGGGFDMTTNYDIDYVAATDAEITALTVNITAQTDTKVYDGTTSSDVLPIQGALQTGDSYTIDATQSFDTRDIGAGKILTAAGAVINDGNNGDNYNINYMTARFTMVRPVRLLLLLKVHCRPAIVTQLMQPRVLTHVMLVPVKH